MILTLGALKNFANFTRKIHVLGSLLKKVSGRQAGKFIKKRLQHSYLPVKLATFSRALILQNNSGGYETIKSKLSEYSQMERGELQILVILHNVIIVCSQMMHLE